MRGRIAGRTLWLVNSTAQGGGVAELLSSVLCYLAGAGIRTRWFVIDGERDFFQLTKGLHHLLHGDGEGAVHLGEDERSVYESALGREEPHLCDLVGPGDPVVLHDPQALGLAPALARCGAEVIWNCHIGADRSNQSTRTAWDFLGRYVDDTRAQVFSRPQYVWAGLDPHQVAVIPPCIDAFSPKNQTLDGRAVDAILEAAGVMSSNGTSPAGFVRQDGTSGLVTHRVQMLQEAELEPGMPLVTQVSRWDPLKDHLGVMQAFARYMKDSPSHLMLAGPAPGAVSDDPEGLQTFDELRQAWFALPDHARSRVHIACLPMSDLEENAAIVNALQRHSDIVVQKSLAEGFGLTVAEAMWKRCPTVGSRVGGIQDQIAHGSSGLLVEPMDHLGLVRAVTSLLKNGEFADALGAAAMERVRDEYLAPRHLIRYLELIDRILT